MCWSYYLLIFIIISIANETQAENIELIQEHEGEVTDEYSNYSNIVGETEENLPFGIPPSVDYNSDMHLSLDIGIHAGNEEGKHKFVDSDDDVNENDSSEGNYDYHYYSGGEYNAEYNIEGSVNRSVEAEVIYEKSDNESQVEFWSEFLEMSSEDDYSLNNITLSETKKVLSEDSTYEDEVQEFLNEKSTGNKEKLEKLTDKHYTSESSDVFSNENASHDIQIDHIGVKDKPETTGEDRVEYNFSNIKADSNVTENDDRKMNSIIRTKDKSLEKSKNERKSSSKQKNRVFKKKNTSNKKLHDSERKYTNDIEDCSGGTARILYNNETSSLEFDACLNYEFIDQLRQEILFGNIININKNVRNKVKSNYLKTESRKRNEGLSGVYLLNNNTANHLFSIWECNMGDNKVDNDDLIHKLNSAFERKVTNTTCIQHKLTSVGKKNELNTTIKNEIKPELSEKVLLSENINTEKEHTYVETADDNILNNQDNVIKDKIHETRNSLLLKLNEMMKKVDPVIKIIDKMLISVLEKLIILNEKVKNDCYTGEYKEIILINVNGVLKKMNISQSIIEDQNFFGVCILISVFVLLLTVLILIKLISLGAVLFLSIKSSNNIIEDEFNMQKKANSIGTRIKVLSNNISQNYKDGNINLCVFSEDSYSICQKIVARNKTKNSQQNEEISDKFSLKELIDRIEENNEMLIYLSNGLYKCAESLYS
ncbi:putative transmembrane protein [Cryptosporidium ryanae]|uniref:putative transmembrane protein n=1 Tax=Cryptosporidium ryanae TaxID=515981 RepID=UPI00351A5736|nr:putative transmembrane protein [Cryptosporidium ryanae]